MATVTATPAETSATGGRIAGVDIARTLAILGMLAVHVGPTDASGPVGRLYAAPYGRASLLFVLLAGVGVALMARSRRTPLATSRVTLGWRAALLLPAGLALQELGHGANVILQDYALFFLLAILAIGVPRRGLLALAATFATLGPVTYLFGRAAFPAMFERTATSLSDPAMSTVHGLVLSGPYPLITWAAPFLFGMWLGHLDLTSTRVRWRLLVIGGAVGAGSFLLARIALLVLGQPTSLADPRFLLTSVAHGQMPLWLVGGTAVATAVLGAALLVGSRLPRATAPLAYAGQVALTVYVGHLLVLHALPEIATSDAVGGALSILAAFTLAILAGATLWRRRFDRGPLEVALHPSWLHTWLHQLRGGHPEDEISPGRSRPASRASASGPVPVSAATGSPVNGSWTRAAGSARDPLSHVRLTRDPAGSP